MLGKQKCKILKEIRQKIADENDIPYVTRECKHQGDCRGTCPRCESELRYLEQQLEARASLGKRVAVAALCAGIAMGSAACSPIDEISSLLGRGRLKGEALPYPGYEEDLAGEALPYPDDEDIVLDGEIAWPDEDIELAGEPTPLPEDYESPGDGEILP